MGTHQETNHAYSSALGYAVGMIRLVSVGLLAMAVTPAMAQRACVMGEASKDAVTALLLQRKLVDTPVEDMEPMVPPALRPQIDAFKDSLAGFVDAMMACATADQTATSMQADLARTLRANQPEKPFTPSNGPADKPVKGIYGDSLKVKVTVPDQSSKLWMIELNFGIECGVDSILLVYEAKPTGWQRLMRWQRGHLEDINSAFGDFFTYAAIPGAVPDDLRIIAAHGHPWCTSRFSGFDIDVLAPSHNANGSPRIIWHTNRGYSRFDSAPKLRARGQEFELRVNAVTMEPADYIRTVIYHYRLQGDQLSRVEPIAANGRGFVEEWLEMPWDEAKDQTDQAALVSMHDFHTLI